MASTLNPLSVKNSVIHNEIAKEMDRRLDYVLAKPQTIISMGTDFYNTPLLLKNRYKDATLLEIDPDVTFLNTSRRIEKQQRHIWDKFKKESYSQIHQSFDTPIQSDHTDMLWSNLSLHISENISNTLQNWKNLLRPDGMLFMATFGPDSLQEIFALLQANNIEVSREKLWDMHDIGDMLTSSGFIQPITDMSKILVNYQSSDNFWEDMAFLRFESAFQIQASKEEYQPLISRAVEQKQIKSITLEIIYAHAIKGPNQHEQVIQFYSNA